MAEVPDAADERAERFRSLYTTHYSAVFAYVLRRARRPHLAADVCSEVFLVAWRRLDEVPDRPRPWLIGVARNTLLALHRKAHLTEGSLEQDLASSEPSPHVQVDAMDRLRVVAQAMSRLSHNDREVLLLSAWEQLNLLELAEALGCSRAAAAVRLHRARHRLKDLLTHPESSAAAKRIHYSAKELGYEHVDR